jgi:hypothetical protein
MDQSTLIASLSTKYMKNLVNREVQQNIGCNRQIKDVDLVQINVVYHWRESRAVIMIGVVFKL